MAPKSRPVLRPTVGSEHCGLGGDQPTCCKGANRLTGPLVEGTASGGYANEESEANSAPKLN